MSSKNSFLKSLKDSLIKETEDAKPVAEQVVEVKPEVVAEPDIDYNDWAYSIVKDESDDMLKLIAIKFNYKERKVEPIVKVVKSLFSRDEMNSEFKVHVAQAGILG